MKMPLPCQEDGVEGEFGLMSLHLFIESYPCRGPDDSMLAQHQARGGKTKKGLAVSVNQASDGQTKQSLETL